MHNDGQTLHDQLPARTRDAEGLTGDGQLRDRIDAAVAALPVDQREVFLLREAMDMPFAEIAKVVGAPENTVKTRMRTALGRLREALDDFREPPGTADEAGVPKKAAESAGTR